MTVDSRSLLLPLHIFVIAGHLFLSQILALLRYNLLKLDGGILLLGPLQDSPGPPVGKVGYAVPVALQRQISISASMTHWWLVNMRGLSHISCAEQPCRTTWTVSDRR